MTLPSFLLIGAPRAGTTALYRYLAEHPAAYMAVLKEPHYFCSPGRRPAFQGPGDDQVNASWVTDLDAYRALFAPAGPRPAGEASTHYLWCPDAPGRVRETLGAEVRLVAVLRDPVERAWSTFHYLRREGLEPCADLLDAVGREEQRAAAGWSPIWRYVELGRYGEQLERWLAVFGREQLLVRRFDDLDERPGSLVQEVYGFLGLPPRDDVDLAVRHNVSGTVRSPALHRVLTGDHALKRAARRYAPQRLRDLARRVEAANVAPPDALDAAVRAELVERFRDDVERLEALLGWDLTAWKV